MVRVCMYHMFKLKAVTNTHVRTSRVIPAYGTSITNDKKKVGKGVVLEGVRKFTTK